MKVTRKIRGPGTKTCACRRFTYNRGGVCIVCLKRADRYAKEMLGDDVKQRWAAYMRKAVTQ